MSYYWATWLPAALSKDPFVAERMVLMPGWDTRGRPPSQFSFLPTGVVEHHTACMIRTGHDPQNCVNAIIAGRSDAPGPISQLCGTFTPFGVKWNGSNPDPRIGVIAAGRANHAGAGTYPWGAPEGNGASLGIEWCGPPDSGWPDIVIELRERVTAAILRHNGWGVHQVVTHNGYAPTRKIDPSGRYNAQPALGTLSPWNVAVWQGRLQARLAPAPTPPTSVQEDIPVKMVIKGADAAHHPVLVVIDGSGTHMTGLTTAADAAAMCALVGQTSVMPVTNALWEDLYAKAVASMPRAVA